MLSLEENLFLEINLLQDLLSSLNAVILINESTQIITGHVIYNSAYTDKFQLKTTLVSVGGGILIFMITAVIMVFMTIEYNKGKEFEILEKQKSEERYHQHQSTNNLDTVSTSTSLSIRCFSKRLHCFFNN